MKNIVTLSFLLFITILSNAQVPEFRWAKSAGGTPYCVGISNVVDASGNVYITGWYEDSVDFDPGPGVFKMGPVDYYDMFILKLDPMGNFLWAKSIGGAHYDNPRDIIVDAAGNCFVTGTFQGIVDFDPGPGVYNLKDSANGGTDAFIVKLNSSGNFVWAKKVGGVDSDYGNSLVLDGSGNIIIAGLFKSTCDFDPGIGKFYLTYAGGFYDMYLLKLDPSGNFIWAKRVGSTAEEYVRQVTVDKKNNIYCSGGFQGTVDFDPNGSTFFLTSTYGDPFMLKLDSAGTFIWAKSIVCPLGGVAECNEIDANGNLIVGGFFKGTPDFDPGSGTYTLTSVGDYDFFILKLDTGGKFAWAKSFGNTGYEVMNSLKVDKAGNIYSTGYFQDTTDLDPGTAVFKLISKGYYDMYISKLDANGNFIWGGQIGGGGDDIGNSIALNSATNNIFTTGQFNGNIDFDLGPGTSFMTQTGSYNLFVLKMSTCQPLTGSFTDSACFSYTLHNQTYTSSGVYTQTLVGANQCDSIVTLNLTIKSVNTNILRVGGTLTALAQPATYQWLKCPAMSVIPGATSQFYVAPVNGDYAVIINEGGCVDTSDCKTVSKAGIDEDINLGNIRIAPNPTKGMFDISVPETKGILRIEVYNCVGELVYTQSAIDKLNFINITDQSNGIYFVKIMHHNIVTTHKLIKTN